MLFVIYIIIGVVVASGHHYFEHLDAVKPIVSAVLAVLLWPSSSSRSTCISSRFGHLASARAHCSSAAHSSTTDRVPAVYGGAVGEPESTICPICGKGTLVTVDFGDQQPESREVQTFTCGHEVKGGRLQTADADRLDVERRQSEETVTPVEPEE